VPDPAQLIAVGRIGPAHGTRGDAYVEPWTDDPEERFAPGVVLSADPTGSGPLTVESSRQHSGRLVVHFAGVDDRNAVEALRGTRLLLAAGERPPLEDPDDFYDTDLIGLSVRSEGGQVFGTVREVVHIGPADYLELDVEGVARLVPFVSAIVPVVDVAGGFILIRPPEGLFDL
jgi:16S rRNA processing protein RimM